MPESRATPVPPRHITYPAVDRRPGVQGAPGRLRPGRPRLGRRLIREGEAGQSILWVAIMLPYFLSIVGLAIDGGIVFSARRELQNVADGAARAGAMQISQWSYRQGFGARVDLDPIEAERVAREYLQANAPQGVQETQVDVDADFQRIVVELETTVKTAFLRLINIHQVAIKTSSLAEVRYGVERGSR